MISAMTMTIITLSLATAYGKNGLPSAFRTEYSRRYCSFSCWFTAGWVGSESLDLDFVHLGDLVVLLGHLQPRRRGDAELHDQVEMRADQGRDQARDQHHVDRIEPGERRRPELWA